MKIQKYKLKRAINCPFCGKRNNSFNVRLMKSGRYKVEAKCMCGFRIKKVMYVEEDKIEYATKKLYDIWNNILTKKKRDEYTPVLTEQQYYASLIKKEVNRSKEMKLEEYNEYGNYSKKM